MTEIQHALLCRSPLHPGESLPSLLIRLAQENCYPAPTLVLQLCRDRLPWRDHLTYPARAATYQVLAELTHIAAEALYMAGPQRFATVVTPPDYAAHFMHLSPETRERITSLAILRDQTHPETDVQFCPLCLQAGGYHRIAWMPLAVTGCLQHQCLLVQGCPRCHTRLTVQDMVATHCPTCAYVLTQTPVTPLSGDPFGLLSQAALQTWLGLSPTMPMNSYGSWPATSPAHLYRFLDGLRRAVMSIHSLWEHVYRAPSGIGVPLFPCTSKHDLTPAKTYILYATAFQALVNWPQGFYAFLDAYRCRDGQSPSPHPRSDLGRLYTFWIARIWRAPTFQFVQEAFEQYLLNS